MSETYSMDLVARIGQIVEKEFERDEVTHMFDHTERVVRFALAIAEREGGDKEVIKLAAWLHDIARPEEFEGRVEDHAMEGAGRAREILEGFDVPNDVIEMVAYAIDKHRFKRGETPETLEAKILQDADRLDAIGAIGIVRAVARALAEDENL
jgi:uncharacterized protein